MPGVRERGEKVRNFILKNISRPDIARLSADKFDVSVQAIYKHLKFLENIGQIAKTDNGYKIDENIYKYKYKIDNSLSEDTVWEKDIKKHFSDLQENVRRIWMYGFLEMFNNAIDHSDAKKIEVEIYKNSKIIMMRIYDNGVGIFRNIKNKLNLSSLDDALLELSKGKTTTDKARHSGEGIFFTSKMFDTFHIWANNIEYRTQNIKNDSNGDKIIPDYENNFVGTDVIMLLENDTKRTTKEVFDRFSDVDNTFSFNKTIVPVRLAATDDLISRSQARRVLSRLELFDEITLDFTDVKSVGQAFADEIFRVFPLAHTNIKLYDVNANKDIKNMINRAKNVRL